MTLYIRNVVIIITIKKNSLAEMRVNLLQPCLEERMCY